MPPPPQNAPLKIDMILYTVFVTQVVLDLRGQQALNQAKEHLILRVKAISMWWVSLMFDLVWQSGLQGILKQTFVCSVYTAIAKYMSHGNSS